MFPRLQLYALVSAAFVLGLFGIYISGVTRGADAARRRATEGRIRSLITSKEIDDEIASLDDPYLVSRASRWLRDPD